MIYQTVLHSLSKRSSDNIFYVDGLGETGKTFVFETIIHYCRGNGINVIGVAWTGIAAILFDAGQTVHSFFSLPLVITAETVPNIKANSEKGRFMKSIDLVIWDEATIAPSFAFDCIDGFFQDLMNSCQPFGDKTLLMGGDFRQCLPIVPHGSVADILAITIKRSKIWPFAKKFKLFRNMRAKPSEIVFKEWLCDMGGGKLPGKEISSHESLIELPDNMVVGDGAIKELINLFLGKVPMS